ncbi:nitroreductase family protein, partial [Pseudoalteromonas sp. SYSU M81241]
PESTPISNATIAVQMAHRTFRSFTDERLTDAELTTLFEVARHTATTAFLQQFTIIHVTDPAIRHQVYQASGQPYVDGPNGDLFVFI